MLRSLATGLAVVGLVLLLACTGEPTPVALTTAPATETKLAEAEEEALVLTGTLRATESELLDTPTSSTWQLSLQWLIDEGSPVEPGDAIARFDPGATLTNLHDKKDQLEEKKQDRESRIAQDAIRHMELQLALRKAEVAYKKAQIDASVPENLLAGKDYRDRKFDLRETDQAFRDAQLDLLEHETASNSRVSELDIEVAELRRDIEELEEELESLTLRASRRGIVLHEMHRWTGQPIRVGDRLRASMPVASIPEVASLEVEAWAGETDAARLQAGMPARILLDADPSRTFHGSVVFVGAAGERRESWGRGKYQRIAIRIDGVDPDVMKPGMSVRCEVALAVPDPALVARHEEES